MWSNTQLQGLTSTVCGDYCVMFLLLRIRGVSLEDFVSWMDKIPTAERRDHIIRRTVLSCFGDLYTPEPSSQGNRRCSCNTRLTLVYVNSFAFIVYILFLYTFIAWTNACC